jgi:hypothetical protein
VAGQGGHSRNKWHGDQLVIPLDKSLIKEGTAENAVYAGTPNASGAFISKQIGVGHTH